MKKYIAGLTFLYQGILIFYGLFIYHEFLDLEILQPEFGALQMDLVVQCRMDC